MSAEWSLPDPGCLDCQGTGVVWSSPSGYFADPDTVSDPCLCTESPTPVQGWDAAVDALVAKFEEGAR